MNPTSFQKYVIISTWGDSLGIAWQLEREGKEVIFGIVNDVNLMKLKEDATEKWRRMQFGKGILDVRKAETLIDQMQNWKDKDEWFVLCDFNNQYIFGKELKDFKYGLFPTKFDFLMESDRDMAKEMVETRYPGVKTAEVEEFKSVEEAKEFLMQSEEFWALKGNDPDGKTVVPKHKDVESARNGIFNALQENGPAYESKGFILERQIRDGVEICVEGTWWDGMQVSAELDIEHKYIGSGNTGFQTGCAGNMIVDIPIDSQIAILGLPEVIQKLARKRRGLWLADANFILKDGEVYYLECGFRPGYDSFQTEVAMAGGAGTYFDNLLTGEKLFANKYGVGIRGFNLKDRDLLPAEGTAFEIPEECMDYVYPDGLYKVEGTMYDIGYVHNAILAIGTSDDPEYAAIKAYNTLQSCSYEGMYYRPLHDWTNQDYHGNITDRLEGVQHLVASPSG